MTKLAVLLLPLVATGFVIPNNRRSWIPIYASTVEEQPKVAAEESKVADTDALLESMASSEAAAQEWADMFGLGEAEKGFYALFEGIRKEIPIGLRGKPFVLRKKDVEKAVGGTSFQGFFTYKDLEKAVNDDFLDAGRGTTDNRKGWKVCNCNSACIIWDMYR